MDLVAEDDIAFLVIRGAPPSTAELEQSWDEEVELVQNVVVKDGMAFLVTCGAPLSTTALEQNWNKVADWQFPL